MITLTPRAEQCLTVLHALDRRPADLREPAQSSEMVAAYAPDALERLFPSHGPEGLEIQRG